MESIAQNTMSIGEESLSASKNQKKEKLKSRKICTVNGMRTDHQLTMVPPKTKKCYQKAVVGLFMREEGSLDLEDEAAREEVKEIFRAVEAR